MVGTLAVEHDIPSVCGVARDAACGPHAAPRSRHREYATSAGNHRKPYISDRGHSPGPTSDHAAMGEVIDAADSALDEPIELLS